MCKEKNCHLQNLRPCPRLHLDKVGRRGQFRSLLEAVFVQSFDVSRDAPLFKIEKIWILNIDKDKHLMYRLRGGFGALQI